MKKFILFLSLLFLVGCGAKVIKIGAVLPQSGQWALYGNAVREGIELAAEYIKENKILNEQIQIMWYDTNSKPTTAVEMMEKAIDDGCVAIIGGITTSEAIKMIDLAQKKKIILMSPTASAAELSAKSTYFFRIFPSDKYEVTRAAAFMVEILGTKNLSILYQDNEFSDFISRNLEMEAKNLGVENSYRIKIMSDGFNIPEAVSQAISVRPNTIYIAAYSDIFPRILMEIKSKNYAGKIVTTSAFNSPGLFSLVQSYAEELYFFKPPFEPNDKNNAVCQNFVKKYKDIYGKDPDIFPAYGFDSLLVLVEGIKLGGTFTDELYKGLRSISGIQGATGMISFTVQGEVLRYPRIYFIKGGQPIDFMEYQEAQRKEIIKKIEKEREELKNLQNK